MEQITKAKSALILDQPFFASLLLGMPMIEDQGIPTLATDGESIRYNPEFLQGKSHAEIVFVLAHETLHCVFQHMHRRGSRDGARWNIAADYVINDVLTRENVGTMPVGCLYDPGLVQRGNGTSEGVYGLLPDSDSEKKPGDIGAGGSMDDCQDASNDPAEMAAKESEMRVKIVQAANAAKMCGKLSAGMERMVKDVTGSRVDWRAVLRRFLTERAKTDLSYARPKRRFLADDLYLPSLVGERLGEIAIAIDCSGSVDPELLSEFAAEIKAIAADTIPHAIHIIYFDSQVLKTETFGPDQEIEIKPIGGGGTRFSPIFQSIDASGVLPAACVVLTDLECSDFGEIPGYPVLWAATQLGRAPFGEIVLIKE